LLTVVLLAKHTKTRDYLLGAVHHSQRILQTAKAHDLVEGFTLAANLLLKKPDSNKVGSVLYFLNKVDALADFLVLRGYLLDNVLMFALHECVHY